MPDYPPLAFIKQIATHCPTSLYVYLLLWEKIDTLGLVSIAKRDIKLDYLMSPSIFTKNLLALVREGLVSIIEDEKEIIELELVLWTDFAPESDIKLI